MLQQATGNGHAEIVQLLIDSGADVAAHTYVTGTPLHMARTRDIEDVEAVLLRNGAPETWSAPSIADKLDTADLNRGRFFAKGCEQCHGTASPDGVHGERAPNFWGIAGRAAGSAADYDYSEHLKAAPLNWNADNLSS